MDNATLMDKVSKAVEEVIRSEEGWIEQDGEINGARTMVCWFPDGGSVELLMAPEFRWESTCGDPECRPAFAPEGAGAPKAAAAAPEKAPAEAECSFKGCRRTARTNGLCLAHYNQQRKTGELKPLRPRTTAADRDETFQLALQVEQDGCVEWPGRVQYKHNNVLKHVQLHVWDEMGGAAPARLADIGTTCGSRSCVNPRHLVDNREAKKAA